MDITVFNIAQRFSGLEEIPGELDNEHIMEMLTLDVEWPEDDETAWCSGFANYAVWLWNKISPLYDQLPRSRSLRARSWLLVGEPVDLSEAEIGYDVVILSRGRGEQPGPDVIDAPGHVGFYVGHDKEHDVINVLGGNQGDMVKISGYPASRLLGVRRLA